MSKSSSGSSDSERERSSSISIDLKRIKVTPDDLSRELERRPEERRTILQLTEELRDNLWIQTKEIHESAPALESGHRILYRVHGEVDGEPDLKSAAEQSGQHPLSAEEKGFLVALHAERNKKSKDGLKSPFVSTTSDIKALVSSTFYGTAGDPNLKNEVFESAPFVSIFRVPSDKCIDVMQGPGLAEKEVLYDTSDAHLLQYLVYKTDNPFRGRVNVGLLMLARARGQETAEVVKLGKVYGKIRQDEPITEDIVRQYSEWYERQTRFYNHL